MKLNESQREIVIKKLSNFFDTSCGVCPNNDWILSDKIFELREFEKGTLTLGGGMVVFPVVAISCRFCGNTHFFNAISLGIIERKDGKTK